MRCSHLNRALGFQDKVGSEVFYFRINGDFCWGKC